MNAENYPAAFIKLVPKAEKRRKTHEEWQQTYRENLERYRNRPLPPLQAKFYDVSKTQTRGRIINWGYFPEMKVWGVRREFGAEYFESVKKLCTLPEYEIKLLGRITCVNSLGHNSMSGQMIRWLRIECQKGWRFFKPQATYQVQGWGDDGKPLIAYDAPESMKRIPLPHLPEGLTSHMKFWYYDGLTGEAVILYKEMNKEPFRFFEPMWLVNLSKSDMVKLLARPIEYADQDKKLAMCYQETVMACVSNNVHAGSDFSAARQNWNA